MPLAGWSIIQKSPNGTLSLIKVFKGIKGKFGRPTAHIAIREVVETKTDIFNWLAILWGAVAGVSPLQQD